jgi:hypothetical protein
VNSTSYRHSPLLSTPLKPCHPERSLAESEANRQTQSKDLVPSGGGVATERNFRIVVRFFDERKAELRPALSRETAAWEIPAQQCRVCAVDRTSPAWTALSNKRITQ